MPPSRTMARRADWIGVADLIGGVVGGTGVSGAAATPRGSPLPLLPALRLGVVPVGTIAGAGSGEAGAIGSRGLHGRPLQVLPDQREAFRLWVAGARPLGRLGEGRAILGGGASRGHRESADTRRDEQPDPRLLQGQSRPPAPRRVPDRSRELATRAAARRPPSPSRPMIRHGNRPRRPSPSVHDVTAGARRRRRAWWADRQTADRSCRPVRRGAGDGYSARPNPRAAARDPPAGRATSDAVTTAGGSRRRQRASAQRRPRGGMFV